MVTDEIRAAVIDHVINHGLSLREAGLQVQPNLQRTAVVSIIRTFRQTNRQDAHSSAVSDGTAYYSVVFTIYSTVASTEPCFYSLGSKNKLAQGVEATFLPLSRKLSLSWSLLAIP